MQHSSTWNHECVWPFSGAPLHIITEQSQFSSKLMPASRDKLQPSYKRCSIAFASKALTDVDTNYTKIKRKCVLVCFSLRKFHTYIYSRHITVDSDHKPLEIIYHKSTHTKPHHLHCMVLCLQTCNYSIQYKPGQDMVLADRLSIFCSHKESVKVQNVWLWM